MATKSTTRRKSTAKTAKSRKPSAAQLRAERQMHAIVLFAVGILLGALVLIQGASVWKVIHNILFGAFGVGSVLVAVEMIYIAVLLTMDKPVKSKAIMFGMLVLCFCSAMQIFKMGIPESKNILDMIIECIIKGIKSESGGFFGALLGLPLLLALGKLGAGIVIFLFIFVLAMLMSGGTLIGIARAAHKPVRKIGEVYTEQMIKQEERATKQPPKAPARTPPRTPPASIKRERIVDIPLPGEEDERDEAAQIKAAREKASNEKRQSEQTTQNSDSPTADVPLDDALSQIHKFEIDIPLDDDFRSGQSGGFSLTLADEEPIKFIPPPEPSLDDLVNKAATITEIFDFNASNTAPDPDEVLYSHPSNEISHIDGFHLNLPPDIDDVEALESGMIAPPKVCHEIKNSPIERMTSSPENKVSEPAHQSVQKPKVVDAPDAVIQEELSQVLDAPPPQPIYHKPPLTLLNRPQQQNDVGISEEMKANAQRLVDTLASFGVQTRIVDISRGPAVTRYELQPSAGVKISKITGLSDDIALNLASAGVRIEAPIPNKAAVGIEVPNKVVSGVTLREIVDSPAFHDAKSKLSVALGRDIAGKVTIADIGKMPHLLIAGSTGSGKSVCINSIIMSLLFQSKPNEVRFLMIDPKVVELGVYNGIPQLLVPVVTDPKKAAGALSWAVTEMLKRYKLFADNSVRDLASFNNMVERTGTLQKMPQIVIIIDELADLMMAAPNEIEDYICRLAQMARAAGMHLIIATQRPSVDVITGVIKANIPSRIAFAVSSQIDSRTILDMGGAEKLLGRGDMLFSPVGASKPIRVQGCFVTDEEIEAVISFIKSDGTSADYNQEIVSEIDNHVVAGKGSKSSSSNSGDNSGDNDDEMLMPAIECVVEAGMASTSLLQRRLKLGYARAARIVDEMESRGIVGPFEGSKPRQVLISPDHWAEMKLANKE